MRWRKVAEALEMPMSTVIDACRSIRKASQVAAMRTVQTQPLTYQWFTVLQTGVFRTNWADVKAVKLA
jgi:hypothetical protein